MKKISSIILILLTASLTTEAQIASRMYNCYKLDNDAIRTSLLERGPDRDTGMLTLLPLIGIGANAAGPRQIFYEIDFSPKYLNQTKNNAKPVLGKHTDNLLPTDQIDSIGLSFMYGSKPVGYKVLYNKNQNGYLVDNRAVKKSARYTSHAYPLRDLADFKNKYNQRDTLVTAGAIVWHNILVVLQEPLPAGGQDVHAVFFIRFKDGRMIRKEL